MVGQLYPGCAAFLNGTNPDAHVAVEVNVNGGPEQFAAGTNYVFAGSLWLALVLHAVGLEIYVSTILTCPSSLTRTNGIVAAADSGRE